MIKKTLMFSNRAYLSLRYDQMVIKRINEEGREETVTRPIEDLGIVMIENPQVTFTAALMDKLLQNNVSVIFCDDRHMPSGVLMPLEKNDTQSEVYNAQIDASVPLKKQLWQQTIVAKILNQAAALRIVNNVEIGNMLAWSKKVLSGDSTNLEARAAVYYWKNIFPQFPEFVRHDGDGNDPNSLLNYGYAILRAIIARSLVSSGLLPTFGIFHKNRYNAYCLADDIMEPYRPYVDLMVNDILNQGYAPEVNQHTKKILLTLPTVDVKIKNLKRPLMIAASITTSSLAKCFLGESRKIIYPELPL